MTRQTRAAAVKQACRYGCGKLAAPGPLTMHERYACLLNPDRVALTVKQPTGQCRYCGVVKTKGALRTHELYGCPERPEPGAAEHEQAKRARCRYCGFTTMPGPLVSHERSCTAQHGG